LVREALFELEHTEDQEIFRMNMIKLRGIPHLCETGYMCYYRDFCLPASSTRLILGPSGNVLGTSQSLDSMKLLR